MMKAAKLIRSVGVVLVSALVFSCDDPELLVVECVDPDGAVPEGEWVCGEEKVVECASPDGTVVRTIYAQLTAGTCSEATLTVSDAGPFELGSHDITVNVEIEGSAEAALCTSTLSVVDTTPPVARPSTIELWPPNHKFHTITIDDCVDISDSCDPLVDAVFTYATSDEPRNSTGDGNTDVDIANLGCRSVDVLAERKGNGDARVYTLGYKVFDASGNVTEGACRVIVPHDQSGRLPVDSGVAYREEAPVCE